MWLVVEVMVVESVGNDADLVILLVPVLVLALVVMIMTSGGGGEYADEGKLDNERGEKSSKKIRRRKQR